MHGELTVKFRVETKTCRGGPSPCQGDPPEPGQSPQ